MRQTFSQSFVFLRQRITIKRLAMLLSTIAVLATVDVRGEGDDVAAAPNSTIRVATFNVSLNRRDAGELREDLSKGSQQARQIATILRSVRPDVVLLNEFDFDESG